MEIDPVAQAAENCISPTSENIQGPKGGNAELGKNSPLTIACVR
jgi:hypothetical protein